jgi:hypothetical protein
VIYFIQAGEGGPVKVGWSVNVPKRLKHLQGANATELRLIGTRPSAARCHEMQLHVDLAEHRIRGEWYPPIPEILDLIEEAA